MGVKSLWELLEPVGRPTPLETLESKRLAIDSSIWLYQFQATMRDRSSGRVLVNAHVLGFLRRISKLLFFGIKPVFVFDGGAPELKRKTIGNRKHKKEGARLGAKEVAERLLAAQLRREAVEVAAGGKGKGAERPARIDDDTVYLEDLTGPSSGIPLPPKTPAKSPTKSTEQQKSSEKKAQWRDHDPYRLPEVDLAARIAARTSTAVPDPRLATEEELRDFMESLDPDSLDVSSPSFRELPTEVQYEIIGDLRLKSRQTSHKRLQGMLKASRTPLDFSKEQIRGLKQRNELTQQLLVTTDSIGQANVLIPVRIASERNREYVLVRSEGAEGGWVLGVRDGPGYAADKPIVIDDADAKPASSRRDGGADKGGVEIPGAGATMDPDLRSFQQSMALAGIGKRQQNPSYNKVATAPAPRRTTTTAQPPKKTAAQSRQASTSQQKFPLFELSDSEQEEEDALPEPLSHAYDIQDDEDPELAAALQMSIDDAVTARRAALRAQLDGSAGVEGAEEEDDDDDDDMEEVFVPHRLSTALSIANAGPFQSPLKRPSASPNKRPPDTPLRTPSGSRAVSGTRRVPSSGTMRTPPGAIPDTPSRKSSHSLPFPPAPSTSALSTVAPVLKTTSSQPLQPQPPSRISVAEEDHGLGVSTLFSVSGRLSTAFSSSAQVPLPSVSSTSAPPSVRTDDEDEDMDMEEVVVPVSTESASVQGPAPFPMDDNNSDNDLYANAAPTIPFPTPTDNPAEGVIEPSPPAAIIDSSLNIAASENLESLDVDEVDDDMEEIAVPSPPVTVTSPRHAYREENAEAGPSRRTPSSAPVRAPSPALSEDSDVIPGWSRSPSPAARAAGKAPKEDHFDAAAEMDPHAEEGGFADFLAQIKGKDLATVRAEIDEEIKELRGQRKNALRDSEDVGGHNMVAQIMVMLRLFGIPYITSPMEAEAQCAELARLGLVDGIITDDSDVFLFGANRVYKDMFNQSKTVRVFLQSDLERELALDRDALIRLAYLLGSDYTEGLQGVGPVVAMELLREFPGADGLWRFREWWARVQSGKDTEEDSSSPFRKRFKKRFKTLYLPPDWPPTNVRDAYLHPNVDDSEEPFKWGVPDLAGLRTLLSSELGWSETKIDDLLLPIIQKMSKREADHKANRQGNLGDWMDVQGEGATTRRAETYKSKRLMNVVNAWRKDRRGKSVTPLGGEEEEPTPKKAKGKKKVGASSSADPTVREEAGRGRGRGRARGRGRGRGGARTGKRKRAEVSEESASGSEFEPEAGPVEAVQRSRTKPRAVKRKVALPVDDEVDGDAGEASPS